MRDVPVDITGRAYGRPAPTYDAELVECGAGTPGGELLRRYWQPFSRADEIADLPVPVRVLGEDLIAFRDGNGDAGLVYPRCMHRGTTLLYGKVEQTGIRCPYHGWLFDTEGHCLEMPCEPQSRVRENIRQPWYPVVERHGLLFTYMGPPARQPLFPRISVLEDLDDDQRIVAGGSHRAPTGVMTLFLGFMDYNWWQFFDNFMDPFHVYSLHANINGIQFVDSLGILPEVTFEYTGDGVRTVQHRRWADGRVHQRISQTIMPNINCTAGVSDAVGPAGVSWTVPRDDTSFRMFSLSVHRAGFDPARDAASLGMLRPEWGPGKPYEEWTLEDHQRWQTDYVTQKGQGDINLHSEEHLTGIDRATSMNRRLFKQQATVVAAGGDPVGVAFDEPYLMRIMAGNAILSGDTTVCLDGYDGRRMFEHTPSDAVAD